MKRFIKNLIRTGVVCSLVLSAATASAQKIQLKAMQWNVLSLKMTDGSNQAHFLIDEFVTLIKENDPDIICFNEFESGSSRMGKEKLAEMGASLNMYPYFIASYPKDTGYCGNGILSKYPIVNVKTALLTFKHSLGEGNYEESGPPLREEWGAYQRSVGYVDILVPTSDSETQMVRVACTHLDHAINVDGTTRQSTEVAAFLEIGKIDYPIILMGDLNRSSVSPGTYPLISVGDIVYAGGIDFIISYPKGRWTIGEGYHKECGKLSDHYPIFGIASY